MFSDELLKIDWEETTAKILSKTDGDVQRALAKQHCTVDDFMALISPAAAPYLEQMAQLSRKYTMERFGKTISMFIPLYITNSCTNSCVYCGFHISNPMPRTILTIEQIEDEYKAIKELGPFENILLVTGENPAKACLDKEPKHSNLSLEQVFLPERFHKYISASLYAFRGESPFPPPHHTTLTMKFYSAAFLQEEKASHHKSNLIKLVLWPIYESPSNLHLLQKDPNESLFATKQP